jgi:hypothetical protein
MVASFQIRRGLTTLGLLGTSLVQTRGQRVAICLCTIDATPNISVGDGATLFAPCYLSVKFPIRTNTRKSARRGMRYARRRATARAIVPA